MSKLQGKTSNVAVNYLSLCPETNINIFTDREEEIESFSKWVKTICQDGAGNTLLVITGPRQIGKTSLMLLFRSLIQEKNLKRLKEKYNYLGLSAEHAQAITCRNDIILLSKNENFIPRFFDSMQKGRTLASVKPSLEFGCETWDMTKFRLKISSEIEWVKKNNPDHRKIFQKIKDQKVILFIDAPEENYGLGGEIKVLFDLAASEGVTDLHFIIAVNEQSYRRDRWLRQIASFNFSLEMFSSEHTVQYIQKLKHINGLTIPQDFNMEYKFSNLGELKRKINGGNCNEISAR